MAEFSAPKVLGISTPRSNDGDLPGFKPKTMLKEASPYVKDAAGMIWPREKWMEDMGDVLTPSWEAPPAPKIQVAAGLDVAHYASPATTTPTRKATRGWPKGKPRKRATAQPEEPTVDHVESGAAASSGNA
jgi:hypothetical protein